MLPIVKGFGEGVATVAGGMVSAARLASDATSILDSRKLKSLQERNARGASLFGSALNEAELKELTELTAKEGERIKFYDDMTKSVEASKTAISSLSKIDTAATETKKSELEAERNALKTEQKQYQADVIAFKADLFDKEMDQSKKQFMAKMRLESEQGLGLAEQKKSRVESIVKSTVKPTVPPKSGDVKANYDKVAGIAGRDFAHAWLYDWELHDLKPDAMPPIPIAEQGKSAGPGTPPPAPVSIEAGEKPATVSTAAIRTAEPKTAIDLNALAALISQGIVDALMKSGQKDKPVDIHVHIDPEGMKHVIRTTIGEDDQRK